MKTDKNILIAFLLNLSFAIFECFGGIFTGSISILSDAVHDLGDAASIGISWILEKKSKRTPDDQHTYGYARYSVLAGAVTTVILLLGSGVVIWNALDRIIHPAAIDHNGMLLFALVGVCVNACGAFFTREGHSVNQKAVNLHMLEDVLGWLVVLVGAVIIRFTGFTRIDPILSIGVAGFILLHALRNLNEILDLLLEKTPKGMDLPQIRNHLMELEGVLDVHHIHIWSMDGQNHYATMHVVAAGDPHDVKAQLRKELQELGISHATLELEAVQEHCHESFCTPRAISSGHHHH